MNLTLDITSVGGHAELAFEGELVRVKWNDTTSTDRQMVKALVAQAKKLGLLPFKTDLEGRPTPEPTKKLPGAIFNKKGEIVLKGDELGAAKLAKELVEQEIREGRLVMVAQKDGSWKIVKPGQFEPKKETKVVSTAKVAGG